MYDVICVLIVETFYKCRGYFECTCICIVFCSTAITEAGKAGDPLTVGFFKEEYTLNFTIGEKLSVIYLIPL